MSQTDPNHPDIKTFILIASTALGIKIPPPKDIFSFAHSTPPNPTQTNLILNRAVKGLKTATTSWPIPSPLHWGVGDYSVILDGEGKPGALMRTTELRVCEFRDVDEGFAIAEGEGDYEEYRTGHLEYYNSVRYTGFEIGKDGERVVFGEESLVLCERFEVVYPRLEEDLEVRVDLGEGEKGDGGK